MHIFSTCCWVWEHFPYEFIGFVTICPMISWGSCAFCNCSMLFESLYDRNPYLTNKSRLLCCYPPQQMSFQYFAGTGIDASTVNFPHLAVQWLVIVISIVYSSLANSSPSLIEEYTNISKHIVIHVVLVDSWINLLFNLIWAANRQQDSLLSFGGRKAKWSDPTVHLWVCSERGSVRAAVIVRDEKKHRNSAQVSFQGQSETSHNCYSRDLYFELPVFSQANQRKSNTTLPMFASAHLFSANAV